MGSSGKYWHRRPDYCLPSSRKYHLSTSVWDQESKRAIFFSPCSVMKFAIFCFHFITRYLSFQEDDPYSLPEDCMKIRSESSPANISNSPGTTLNWFEPSPDARFHANLSVLIANDCILHYRRGWRGWIANSLCKLTVKDPYIFSIL